MNIFKSQRASIEHPERCEDALVLLTDNPENAPVFAVIDGMGGHQRQLADGQRLTGQEAAQAIAETLRAVLNDLPVDISADPGGEADKRVREAIDKAHQHVLTSFNADGMLPPRQRLGAVVTIVVLCENGKRLLVAQVGDTRAYLLSDDELIQLCIDEDNIEYLVRSKMLSTTDADRIGEVLDNFDGIHDPEPDGSIAIAGNQYELYQAWRWFLIGNQALNIPAANVVISAVGLHPIDPTPETSRIEISEGDTLLLCSDGLYKNMSVPEIIAILKNSGDEDPSSKLLKAAYVRSQDESNQRHTPDDITAIVVEFAPPRVVQPVAPAADVAAETPTDPSLPAESSPTVAPAETES